MSELSAKIHDLYSQRLYLPLSNLRRVANPSRRAVVRAFQEGMRFRQQSLTWSPDRKQDWILRRLRSVVRTAYLNTDYYRQLFTRIGFDVDSDFSFDDFARLPVLEREDINRTGKTLLSKTIPHESLKRDSTGGSTGMPTIVWLGPEEQGWRESSSESFMRRIGAPAGTRTSFLWGHHLDPVRTDSPRDKFYAFSTNARWFDCFRLSPELMDQYHEELQKFRPACIIAYATALGRFAEHLLERGYEVNYPTNCAITGAEKLSERHRKAAAAAFKRPIHERYGGRDVGGIAFQIDPQQSLDYEIDWSNLLVEPETDDPDSPILITKLHADGMPMIRYRIGDIGHFKSDARPGHPTFMLSEVIGREADCIWTPNGHRIQGEFFPHMLKDYPIREFMLYQYADYSIELRVAPNPEFNELSSRRIINTMQSSLPDLKINLVLVDEIPRNKANKLRPVVSEVNPSISKTSRRSAL